MGKYIPDLADLTEPLRELLKKGEKFIWGPVQDQRFQKLMSALAKIPSLSYIDPNSKTRFIADPTP